MTQLRITEVFYSLQGESLSVGCPTVFIRLTGCPLRCVWCDSAYAFNGGQMREVDDLLREAESYGAKYVCVTGGEPLAQPGVHDLLSKLCDKGYQVSLETSGALDVSAVDPRVVRVMDLKAPDSGEVERNRYENIQSMLPHDQIKFVIGSRRDFDWACMQMDQHQLADKVAAVLMSPVHNEVEPKELADWVLASKKPIRMQLQLHKYLWGEEPGH